MRGLEEFQATELAIRDVAARELDLERPAMMRGAEEHGLRFQRDRGLAVLEHAIRDEARLLGLIGDRDEGRAALAEPRSEYRFLAEALLGEPGSRRSRPRDGSVASSGNFARA